MFPPLTMGEAVLWKWPSDVPCGRADVILLGNEILP